MLNIDSFDSSMPTSIQTTEDLARIDIERDVQSGKLPADTDVEAAIAEREAQVDCLARRHSKGLAVDLCLGS